MIWRISLLTMCFLFMVYIVKLIVVSIFMLTISPQLTGIVYLTVIPMMVCVMCLRFSFKKEVCSTQGEDIEQNGIYY